MKSNILVSVIIPTFNRSKQVMRAVESVLRQTYEELECIVVDDASSDDTVKLLKAVEKNDDRLRILVHDKNMHVSAARNTGIAAANGEYIAFLDDDDVWFKDKLFKQEKLLSASVNEIGMVYCWFDIIDGQDKIGSRKPNLRGKLFDDLLVGQPLGNASTLLVRKQVIKKIGGFDTDLPRGNDGDFIRRITKYYRVELVREVLVNYHVENVELNPRISLMDKVGLQNDINSIQVKLQKFKEDFNKKPDIHFTVLKTLLQRYVVALEFRNAMTIFRKASGVCPKKRDKHFLLLLSFLRALITLIGRLVRG